MRGVRQVRRGIKEMDLILGAYEEARLAGLDDDRLDRYEALLDENDQDLYKWVSGRAPEPASHTPMIDELAHFHGIRR